MIVSMLQTAVSDWEEIICTGSHSARKCTEMNGMIIQCIQTALHSDIWTLGSGRRSGFLATMISRPQYSLFFLLGQYEIIVYDTKGLTPEEVKVYSKPFGVFLSFRNVCVRSLRRPVETSFEEKKNLELYF
jgi:hypothetical protein